VNPLPVASDPHVSPQNHSLDEDHGLLKELTARLAAAGDRTDLTEALEDLAHALREHFIHEEHARGPYERLAARGPSQQAETARFKEEHRELLRDLGELVWRSQERGAPTRELGREAAELTARLHDHEAREMRALQATA
jgi:hemerythrin